MSNLTLALFICIAVLAGVVVALLVALARRKQAEAERQQAHNTAIAEITADGQRLVAAAINAKETAEQDRAKAAAAAAELRRQIAEGMKWDRITRDDIVSVFAASASGRSASGFVATDVVFCPVEGTDTGFSAQLDHVLVCTDGILIVESKRWDGVVFNSTHPKSVNSTLGLLFDMTTTDSGQLTMPFAIQAIAPKQLNAVTFTVHDGRKAPVRQVQQQAKRLKALLNTQLQVNYWVYAMVYFSHPNATVFSPNRDDKTIIVSSKAELQTEIERWRAAPHTPLSREQIEQIAGYFAQLGADIQGIGRDTGTWQSVIAPKL